MRFSSGRPAIPDARVVDVDGEVQSDQDHPELAHRNAGREKVGLD